jgi:subtilisin family serine protease
MDERWLWRFTLLTLALFCLAGPAVAAGPPVGASPAPAKFAPGEVLVKFKNATPPQIISGPAVRGEEAHSDLPVQAQAALAQIRGKVKKAFVHVGLHKVQIPDNLAVGQAIEALYRSGAVEYAEPNYPIRPCAVTPNDPYFVDGSLWGLHNTGQNGGAADADIDAPEAWALRTNASTTLVGVIDTGIDYNHEDLKDNMWVNPHEIPGNGIDDDGNGYVDDVYGINIINSNGDPMDGDGHGTHVAGIIGARGNNGKGVTGVAWTTQLMALRCMSDEWGGVLRLCHRGHQLCPGHQAGQPHLYPHRPEQQLFQQLLFPVSHRRHHRGPKSGDPLRHLLSRLEL